MDEGALEVVCLSLRELCEGNKEEGLLCWGSGRIWGGGLRGWASLSVGAPLGCMGRCPFTWNSESWKALGMGHLSPRKLYEGNLEGGLLYW